jgi:hypothetical protein
MATALRLKAHWFKPEQPKSSAQTASAIAFIVWRVARQMIDRMRKADFDIPAGPMYFGVLRESLVALCVVVDRIAFARQDAQAREAFTHALVVRVAELVDENETEWLGPPPAGQAPWRDLFIDQFNVLSQHYAEFDCDEHDGPDFGFKRYLGTRLEPLLPEKDRRWIVEQVMEIELPDAVQLVQRGMLGVFSKERAPRRASPLGGD